MGSVLWTGHQRLSTSRVPLSARWGVSSSRGPPARLEPPGGQAAGQLPRLYSSRHLAASGQQRRARSFASRLWPLDPLKWLTWYQVSIRWVSGLPEIIPLLINLRSANFGMSLPLQNAFHLGRVSARSGSGILQSLPNGAGVPRWGAWRLVGILPAQEDWPNPGWLWFYHKCCFYWRTFELILLTFIYFFHLFKPPYFTSPI